MRTLAAGLLVIAGTSAVITGANAAHKEGHIGGVYKIVLKSYWNGKAIDGTLMNNAARKVRCVQAEFVLADENSQRVDTTYYIPGTSLAIGDSLSFSVSAAKDCVRSLQHFNVAKIETGFHV